MTQINLLPWREAIREQRKQRFFFFLGCSAASGILLMLMTHMVISHRLENQRSRNNYLKAEIKKMDKNIAQIKLLQKLKSAMLSRMGIIQELEISRTAVVHFFADLPQLLPKGVFISKVDRQGPHIFLDGLAESNTNISKLMRNIEASLWMTQPVLNEIKTVELSGKRANVFKLQLTLGKAK